MTSAEPLSAAQMSPHHRRTSPVSGAQLSFQKARATQDSVSRVVPKDMSRTLAADAIRHPPSRARPSSRLMLKPPPQTWLEHLTPGLINYPASTPIMNPAWPPVAVRSTQPQQRTAASTQALDQVRKLIAVGGPLPLRKHASVCHCHRQHMTRRSGLTCMHNRHTVYA